MDYLGEQATHRIKNVIKKYGLNVQLISRAAPQLSSLLKVKDKERKCDKRDCRICSLLNGNYKCNTRYVVYKMTCQICNKFYIGQTNRPFHYRYREHEHSLKNKNAVSALSEHAITEHQSTDMSIAEFKVDLIEVYKDPVECKIGEAKCIEGMKPGLNRQHELRHW